MPALAGWSHLSLSVRDRDTSVAFYRDVLGFRPFEVLDDDRWLETICVHPETGMVLGLQQHPGNPGEPFAHPRTGLDHVAFRVAGRAELDEWPAALAEHGVRHSPVADKDYGSVLCLRDPDDIQLELFFRSDHP